MTTLRMTVVLNPANAISSFVHSFHSTSLPPKNFPFFTASKSARRRFHRQKCTAVTWRWQCCSEHKVSNKVAVATDDKYANKQVITVTPQLYDYILGHIREPQILRELREETSGMQGSQMQGYSSLAVALVLPESGHLVACERDLKCLEVAKSYDFAFLDAEKRMYSEYYELLLQLIRPGGLIVIDNVLWHGKVANPLIDDKKTTSLRDFNKVIFNDERVSISMVPIGDGMTICRKR